MKGKWKHLRKAKKKEKRPARQETAITSQARNRNVRKTLLEERRGSKDFRKSKKQTRIKMRRVTIEKADPMSNRYHSHIA